MRRIANAILTNATAGAAIFGLMHALVDLSCLAVLYWHVQRQSLSGDGLLTMVILYNCIAFGLQGPLGWATDALGAYRAAAAVGLVLTACGASAADWPWHAAVVSGLGNALFHVGAGGSVLRSSPGRASLAGVFVAPGAFGVTAGIWLGMAGFPWRWIVAACLAGSAVLTALIAPRMMAAPRAARGPGKAGVQADSQSNAGGVSVATLLAGSAIVLLAGSVCVRSLAGGAIRQWVGASGEQWLLWLLTLAAVAGKAGGGVLSDALGWRRVCAVALVVAAGLSIYAQSNVTAALVCGLLVQVTMAVTLAGVFSAMPTRPGLAFGVLSTALLAGALPDMGLLAVDATRLVAPLLIMSMAMIVCGLTLVRRRPAGGPA